MNSLMLIATWTAGYCMRWLVARYQKDDIVREMEAEHHVLVEITDPVRRHHGTRQYGVTRKAFAEIMTIVRRDQRAEAKRRKREAEKQRFMRDLVNGASPHFAPDQVPDPEYRQN